MNLTIIRSKSMEFPIHDKILMKFYYILRSNHGTLNIRKHTGRRIVHLYIPNTKGE